MEQLTRDEKIRLLSGQGMWHTYDCGGKLPSIMMTDGPHGLRKQEVESTGMNDNSKPATCFPTASAMAATWDVEAIGEMANAIAEEALAEQVSVVLGCGVNIKRSPLCGRNFEYFSEDPYLAGRLATSYIQAMQKRGVGTSLKHFCANNQETRRMTANSQIDERALREIYLPAFEMAVKEAKPTTVMVSYNRLNGQFMTENRRMLYDILRKEWGYEGTVISDWGAVANLDKSIAAGIDLEMPDSCGNHKRQVDHALDTGSLPNKEFERAVDNVTNLVVSQAEKLQVTQTDFAEHHLLARRLAAESAVLLKNDGFLPLNPKITRKVLVVGDMAVHMRFQGGGSSHITITQDTNVVRSLGDAGIEVIYAKGYRADRDAPEWELEKEALRCAKEGMPILFFGGLTEKCEGEGFDRRNLEIPPNQLRLFEKLRFVNQQIAFFSFGGSAMTYPILDAARAVMHMYLAGQAVGEACADLILGKMNPSGKLPETFPVRLTDVPSYAYFGLPTDDVEYRESIYVGYRYYDKYRREVLFPFGYGLSYTRFSYSDLKLSHKKFVNGTLQVTFKIKNTGSRSGKEVAQVYVENPECKYLRPVRELRGFVKIALEPGEEKEVTVTLDERSFSIYDDRRKMFFVPGGEYKIQIGESSRDICLEEKILVDGGDYGRDDTKIYHEYFEPKGEIFEISKAQFSALYARRLSSLDIVVKGNYTMQNSLEQLAKKSLLAKIILKMAIKSMSRIHKGKGKDNPELTMMIQNIREGTLDCVICQSGGRLKYSTGQAVVLSANGQHKEALAKLFMSK